MQLNKAAYLTNGLLVFIGGHTTAGKYPLVKLAFTRSKNFQYQTAHDNKMKFNYHPTANFAACFHIKCGIGVFSCHVMLIGWLPWCDTYSTSPKFTKPMVLPYSSLLCSRTNKNKRLPICRCSI